MAETPVREHDQFLVRMPPGMREELARLAKENRRSMNAEIIARLESTLDPSKGTTIRIEESARVPDDIDPKVLEYMNQLAETQKTLMQKLSETFLAKKKSRK